MEKSKYILLKDLEVYQMARKLSEIGWKMYDQLTWQDRKIMGDQFIESTDSVGANIAEGYGRYHYLNRIKFYYNSRASYMEAKRALAEFTF
jgi:four helix bundle protein